jgi:serine/threonine protein kinase
VNNKRLDEKESSLYYFQLIQGLEYIHSLKIVHRDLKPENLLITKKRILKIIDFGLSNYFLGDELMLTPCGSPSYTPPEMIKGYKYNGFAVDIWSTGIILFGMLCGYLPFEERDSKALFKKIIKCKVIYPKFLSLNSKNLLKKILVANPDKRITINEIKKHPFYLEGKEIFYKRYPDLIEKIENSSNNILVNDNNSAPHNNCFIDTNNIKITTFSISDKKENDEKDKSSSNFTKYSKNRKLGPNFDLLKKILRGSKTNSSEKRQNY